jgi:hypothetical protein
LDRLAIQDLIHRYSDAVTRADYEQMATVFAPDAVWESPVLNMRYERASDFIAMQIEGNASLDVLIQTAHNPVVTLDGPDLAHATTTIHERIRGIATEIGDGVLGEAGSELNVDQYGIYFDTAVRADGAWKFTRRLFVPYLIGSGTVVGDVVTPRPLVGS